MALRHLELRDFVIVPELALEFDAGFSALTGETGAGKSILVDALQLALGARGDPMWIREGQPRCEIAAEFDRPAAAAAWLDEAGFDAGAPTILARRTIDAAGKSRAWINGSPATIGQLRELGAMLVDIHGQHAWQSLTRPGAVRELLDDYAGVDRPALRAAWQAWKGAEAALAEAQAAQASVASERDRLAWQIGEIEKLGPGDDEWGELNQRHTRLAHAQALIEAAQQAAGALEGDDSGDAAPAALGALARALEALEAQAAIEPQFGPWIEVLQACDAQMRDVAHSLKAYLRHVDLDPQQMAEIDARVGAWLALARRFHRPPEELPALLADWRAELQRLEAGADLDHLQAAASAAHTSWLQEASRASGQRRQAAPRLADAVSQSIQALGMIGGVFAATLETLTEPAAFGLEDTHFLLAAHAKGTPRPLDRVASGGELSRLALAVAVTTSAAGSAETLIFDEVDAGIGGAVASTVGQLLRRLGQTRQVLCVTHLAQVASCADHHLLVSKNTSADGGVASTVRPVTDGARTEEIARMLGGERLSATTLAHAREMLADAAALPAVASEAGA